MLTTSALLYIAHIGKLNIFIHASDEIQQLRNVNKLQSHDK